VELQEGKKREDRKEAMKSVWLGQKKMGIKRKTNCCFVCFFRTRNKLNYPRNSQSCVSSKNKKIPIGAVMGVWSFKHRKKAYNRGLHLA
jgi:hypothetical protein